MYIDRRHKYFVWGLSLVLAIIAVEVVAPDLVWWQRWLFAYAPIGIAVTLLARAMGWYVDPPTNEWDAMTPEERERVRFSRR